MPKHPPARTNLVLSLGTEVPVFGLPEMVAQTPLGVVVRVVVGIHLDGFDEGPIFHSRRNVWKYFATIVHDLVMRVVNHENGYVLGHFLQVLEGVLFIPSNHQPG